MPPEPRRRSTFQAERGFLSEPRRVPEEPKAAFRIVSKLQQPRAHVKLPEYVAITPFACARELPFFASRFTLTANFPNICESK